MRVVGIVLAGIGGLVSLGAASAASTLETVYSFKGNPSDGATPIDGLVQGAFGAYYGVTANGGTHSEGGVFQLTLAGGKSTEKLIYSFNDTLGSFPGSQAIADTNGALYGTTEHGSSTGQGVVYKLTPPQTAGGSWAASMLYKFAGGATGQEPHGRLLMDAAGALYGTAYNGGSSTSSGGTKCLFGCGLVFKLTPPSKTGAAWTYSVLYKFRQGTDGSHPVKGLVTDMSGALYGTTLNGGSQNCNNGIDLGCGVVFKLKPPAAGKTQWTEQVIYRLADNNGGASIPTELYLDGSGNVFGGAPTGGKNKTGVVYQLSPVNGGSTYTPTIAHSFTSSTGISDLIADNKGTLYGTTSAAGLFGFGAVFDLAGPAAPGKPRVYGILYNFLAVDGHSLSNLLQETDGAFLGLTQDAGTHKKGSVYQLTP